MIARLLISPNLEDRKQEIQQTIASHIGSGNTNHPDVLYYPVDSKLGIEQARKIKEHFSLKPYSAKGRVVVLENGSDLTPEGQNALLKTLEELPENGLFILGADSDAKFLPTVLSRCHIEHLSTTNYQLPASPTQRGKPTTNYLEDIEKLLDFSIEQRFEYIEKLKDRAELLPALVTYFHKNLASHMSSGNVNLLKELMQAEQWQNQNVNIRAILEYLMLVMPQK
ncbi:hypothetical protein HYS92_02235 [Candidatus Daviesbacteria bacterium]|nr:hypothetical protein [Candidatus Daviesbacteria bacterium]